MTLADDLEGRKYLLTFDGKREEDIFERKKEVEISRDQTKKAIKENMEILENGCDIEIAKEAVRFLLSKVNFLSPSEQLKLSKFSKLVREANKNQARAR